MASWDGLVSGCSTFGALLQAVAAAITQLRSERKPEGGLLTEECAQNAVMRGIDLPRGPLTYARLALAEGDPERAARLKGAAESLRQRVGLPAWPDLRREEELVAQIRQKLSAVQFDQAFSAGSELTQR